MNQKLREVLASGHPLGTVAFALDLEKVIDRFHAVAPTLTDELITKSRMDDWFETTQAVGDQAMDDIGVFADGEFGGIVIELTASL